MQLMLNDLLFLISGILSGSLISWFIMKQRAYVYKESTNRQITRFEKEAVLMKDNIASKEKHINTLTASVSEKDADIRNLRVKIDEQKEDIERMNERLKTEFKNLANEILDEKSRKFTEQNNERLKEFFIPFSENLNDFRKMVENTYLKEEEDKDSLFKIIKEFEELNIHIGYVEQSHAKSLKEGSVTQSKWREMLLESILEKSGLVKDREYIKRTSLVSDEEKEPQSNYMVKYPGERAIVIDANVPLTAFERYCNTEERSEKEALLKEHLSSVRKHIDELKEKKHLDAYQLTSLDFVMMFIPSEHAFLIAIQTDPDIWQYAYEKRILMISPTSMITALKMIENMWRQEYINRNILEIAAQGGSLYDDFVTLSQRLLQLGEKLDDAKEDFDYTIKKLKTGKGSLIRKIETFKNLGIKTKKTFPGELLAGDQDSSH